MPKFFESLTWCQVVVVDLNNDSLNIQHYTKSGMHFFHVETVEGMFMTARTNDDEGVAHDAPHFNLISLLQHWNNWCSEHLYLMSAKQVIDLNQEFVDSVAYLVNMANFEEPGDMDSDVKYAVPLACPEGTEV